MGVLQPGRDPTPTLLVATRSAHKLDEIRRILGDCGADVASLDDLGVPRHDDEEGIERFDSFAENALAKAAYFCERTGLPTVADDSGIVVPALGGRPGVLSRRFAETLGVVPDEADRDATNLRLLLEQMAGLDDTDRRAYYACLAALAVPAIPRPARGDAPADPPPPPAVRLVAGTCDGVIARAPRGSGGFGYDPVFLVPELDLTFGEASPDAKHRLSHRARAFRALAACLPAALAPA